MHILVVIHDFQPGGAERIAVRLASRWASQGEQVSLVCGNPSGALKSLLGEDVRLLIPDIPIKRSKRSRIAVAAFAARMARSVAADVIFLPGNFYAGMAPVLRFRLGRRCPSIITKFSNMLRRPGRGWAGQLAFQTAMTFHTASADRIVVMSPELRNEARHFLLWRETKYSLIAQPVLDDLSTEIAPKHAATFEAVPLLIAAGRLIAQKNFAGLIDAVARLERPFRLMIFGEGPARPALETKIANLRLSDRVTLPGYVSDPNEMMASARLFLLSSDYEGFPSVVVEALAAGVPVIATDCSPAIAGILKSEELGKIVPTGDPGAMAAAIADGLDRPPSDQRTLVQSVGRFRIGPSAAAYLELFRGLIAAKANRGPK